MSCRLGRVGLGMHANIPNVANVCHVVGRGTLGIVPYVRLVTVDPWSDTPLYAQLAAILRARIERGELRRLDALPSESQLAQEFELGRDTVRRAIAQLRSEGVIFTIAHRGSFVGPRPEQLEDPRS